MFPARFSYFAFGVDAILEAVPRDGDPAPISEFEKGAILADVRYLLLYMEDERVAPAMERFLKASGLTVWERPSPQDLYELLCDAVDQGRISLRYDEEGGGAVLPVNPQPKREKKPEPEPKPVTKSGWFEVQVVDEVGFPLPGLEVVFGHSGRRETLPTDGAGVARLEGANVATSSSFASVAVKDLDKLKEALQNRWQSWPQPGELPKGPNLTYYDLGRALSSLQLESETRHTLVCRPYFAVVRLIGMHFDRGKNFLLPSAMVGIKKLGAIYQEYPEAGFLVTGHTDAANLYGIAGLNQRLSEARAKIIQAYLCDDPDAWLPNYRDEDTQAKWGATEDRHMLRAVGFYPPPKPVEQASTSEEPQGEHHADPDLVTAINNYQTARGLTVDGVAGPVTRRALIADYMALDAVTFGQKEQRNPGEPGVPKVQKDRIGIKGYAEQYPAVQKRKEGDQPWTPEEQEAHDRRVEIFVLPVLREPLPDYAVLREIAGEEWDFESDREEVAIVFHLPAIGNETAGATPLVPGFGYRIIAGGHVFTGVSDVPRVSLNAPPGVRLATAEWWRLLDDSRRYARTVHLLRKDAPEDDTAAYLMLNDITKLPTATVENQVAEFQASQNLTPTGDLDAPTRDAIRLAFSAAIGRSSTPPGLQPEISLHGGETERAVAPAAIWEPNPQPICVWAGGRNASITMPTSNDARLQDKSGNLCTEDEVFGQAGWHVGLLFKNFDDLLEILEKGSLPHFTCGYDWYRCPPCKPGQIRNLALNGHGDAGLFDIECERKTADLNHQGTCPNSLRAATISSWRGHLRRLEKFLASDATVYFMACLTGQGDIGDSFLKALSVELSGRRIVAFTKVLYSSHNRQGRSFSHNGDNPGARVTEYVTEGSPSEQTKRYGDDATWNNLKTLPWAGSDSPHAKWAKDGKIVGGKGVAE